MWDRSSLLQVFDSNSGSTGNATMDEDKFINFEEAWQTLHNGIMKLYNIVEGLSYITSLPRNTFCTVYNMCIQKVFDYYNQHDYMTSTRKYMKSISH
jgi:hypothetical protein